LALVSELWPAAARAQELGLWPAAAPVPRIM